MSTHYENPKLGNPIRKTTSSTHQYPGIQNIIIIVTNYNTIDKVKIYYSKVL